MIEELAIRAAEMSELAYANREHVSESFREFRWIDEDPVQGFVARENGVVWIVFRGTDPDKIKDWIVNLRAKKTNAFGMKGTVHRGFFEAMESVLLKVKAAFDDLFQDNDKIVICGHSQGATLAVLYAARLCEFWSENNPPTIHLFGCPRVGNTKFAKLFDDRFKKCYRCVNNNDVVTRVPLGLTTWLHRFIPPLKFLPMGFRHIGQLMYFDHCGVRHESISRFELFKDRFVGRLWHFGESWLSDGIEDHDIGRYVNLIKEINNQ